MKRFIVFFFFFLSASINAFSGAGQCPFCREEVHKTQQVFETAYFRVILDYAPIVRGHLLVVPKRHVMKADELVKEEWDMLGVIIPKVVRVFHEAFSADQYILLEKNGPLSGQTVPHVHFHLIPIASPQMAEQARQSMFAKFFDTSPKKLSAEEVNQMTSLLKPYFERE